MKKIRNTSDCRWSFHSFTVSYFAITVQIKRIMSSGISLRLYIYFISLLCSISRLFSIFSNSSSDYLIRFLLFVSLLIRRGNVQWYIHSIVTYLFFFFYECCFFKLQHPDLWFHASFYAWVLCLCSFLVESFIFSLLSFLSYVFCFYETYICAVASPNTILIKSSSQARKEILSYMIKEGKTLTSTKFKLYRVNSSLSEEWLEALVSLFYRGWLVWLPYL